MHVHVVNASNRRQYLDEIEQMHRHRHRVFVGQRGWKALDSPDGLDIDEFDTPNATYLVAIDGDGIVRGSCRMIPSWRPHMLRSLFADYVEGDAPSGPSVWEWTRHAPGDKTFEKDINHQARFLLNIAAHEFAASRGIETFIGIADCQIVPRMIDLGWRVEPIGMPVNYGEGVGYAFKMNVEPSNNDKLRARLGRTGTVLVEMPRGLVAEEGAMARRTIELAMSLPPASLNKAEEALRGLVKAAA
jgi:N-acyl-L-homoserine lactone synthetase